MKDVATFIEEKTNIRAEYIAAGIGALLVILIFTGIFAHFITDLIGFLYPVYATIISLEKDDKDNLWLTYWVIFGSFCLLEKFVDYLLFWVPFYYPFKISFLVWCMHPKFRGSIKVYETFLKPHVGFLRDPNDEKKDE